MGMLRFSRCLGWSWRASVALNEQVRILAQEALCHWSEDEHSWTCALGYNMCAQRRCKRRMLSSDSSIWVKGVANTCQRTIEHEDRIEQFAYMLNLVEQFG